MKLLKEEEGGEELREEQNWANLRKLQAEKFSTSLAHSVAEEDVGDHRMGREDGAQSTGRAWREGAEGQGSLPAEKQRG